MATRSLSTCSSVSASRSFCGFPPLEERVSQGQESMIAIVVELILRLIEVTYPYLEIFAGISIFVCTVILMNLLLRGS